MSIFEGVMGNTSNLRVIKFLLPFTHAQFNEKDLMEEVGVSKPTMIKVIKKLVEFEMIVPTERRGNSTYYRVNTSSPFIKAFEDIDNLIIQYKYGDLMVDDVDEPQSHVERVKADPPTPF
jgi:DNA-binding transcriptional regulator GbsR (MarR family)